ncbi:MAG: universal stress protein [Dehalococcoidia bacterium]|nr:universal stress protein [Dehalococcoidia bacterium]
MYKKILVPLDGSSLAEEALAHVENISQKYGSEVVLFEAAQPIMAGDDPSGFSTSEIYGRLLDESIEAAKVYIEKTAASLREKGVNVVKQEVKVGNAAELIIDEAEAVGADLIIMASHGRSGIKRWFFGSVAERVLRHSTAPILLVKCTGTC